MSNSIGNKKLDEGTDHELLSLEEELNKVRDEFIIEDVMIDNSLNDLKEILPDATSEDLGVAGAEFEELKKKYNFLKDEYIRNKIQKKYGSLTEKEIKQWIRDENIKEFTELEEGIVAEKISSDNHLDKMFFGDKVKGALNIELNNIFARNQKQDEQNQEDGSEHKKLAKSEERENLEEEKSKPIIQEKDNNLVESETKEDKHNRINEVIESQSQENIQTDVIEEDEKSDEESSTNINKIKEEVSSIDNNKKEAEKDNLKAEVEKSDKYHKEAILKNNENKKENAYIDFNEILSETEVEALEDVNLQRTKFMNNVDKHLQSKSQESQIESSNQYSREEAITGGLTMLLLDELSEVSNRELKQKIKDDRQFELIKNDIVNFCEEVNENDAYSDDTGEITAELLFKYNQRLYNIIKQNKLNFPSPRFCNVGADYKIKKDNFYYFLNEYLRGSGIFFSKKITETSIKGEQFKKIFFELYEIAGKKEERLIDDKIRKLKFLDNLDRNELGELIDRYINIFILSDSLLEKNKYTDFEYSGCINHGDIVIYGNDIEKSIKEKFNYLSPKEYLRQIAIPREKAYIIGNVFGMNQLFKEGLSDGFFLEYVENDNFQDLVDERISASMHNPTHIISYFCLKGSLEKLEKNEKTDPIQIFNQLNNKKSNSLETIEKFKKRYWEIFNDLYNANNKEILLEEIRNLGIRGIDDDLEKVGF